MCSFCPNCSDAIPVSTQLLIVEAKARIKNHTRLHLSAQDVVRPTTLVIEDDCGTLLTCQGDLSFLVKNAPVIDVPFSPQLHEYLQDSYKKYQKWIWDIMDESDAVPLFTSCGELVKILNMYVNKEMYTVTMFVTLAKPS